jgi:indolepyruvate ferredoxin oxidoreductase
VHDLIIYDRGVNLENFVIDIKGISKLYHSDLLEMAVRILTKTYFVKDEVFVAHLMISPMRKLADESAYKNLGTSFSKKYINRPSFDIGTKKIEFDFSPKPWMLKFMRQGRFLRKLMPNWHQLERQISQDIRQKLLSESLTYSELKALENIKGYRDVRYEIAQASFLKWNAK